MESRCAKWVTLTAILPRDVQPTLLHAFLLEAMGRLITVVFKFVPWRVGVDEAAPVWRPERWRSDPYPV